MIKADDPCGTAHLTGMAVKAAWQLTLARQSKQFSTENVDNKTPIEIRRYFRARKRGKSPVATHHRYRPAFPKLIRPMSAHAARRSSLTVYGVHQPTYRPWRATNPSTEQR